MKQQPLRHNYGDSEDDGDDDDGQLVAGVNDMIGNGEELLSVEGSVIVDQLSSSVEVQIQGQHTFKSTLNFHNRYYCNLFCTEISCYFYMKLTNSKKGPNK